MEPQEIRFPFTQGRPVDHSSYFKMIQSYFVPNFKLMSVTTVLLGINILIFLVIHIIFPPGGYSSFLQWPSEMDKLLLDVELIKYNRVFFYQTLTAMFMHMSYTHIVGNMIIGMFLMYELEHSWRPSIFLGLLAGFLANCLAIFTLEGRFLGFSGVITSYMGMLIALVIIHCSYIQRRMG